MLGRSGFEVLDDSLFLVGTENYPELRRQLFDTESKTGLRILPAGTNLAGPRSDHIAFETMGIPALSAVALASSLFPMRAMVSGRGPMKTRPAFSQASANSGFSERKP